MSLLYLFDFTSMSFLSSPDTAEKCRDEVDKLLIYHKKVEIDFSNVHATAGFIEHFLKPLLEKRGKNILSRLFFANCSDTAEYSINQLIKNYNQTALHQIH